MMNFKPRVFCSHATSHKSNWILTVDCYLLCLAFFVGTSVVWRRFLKWNVQDFDFSRILFRLLFCLCNTRYVRILISIVFSHSRCFWFTCLMYLLVCVCAVFIVYRSALIALAFIAFSLSISFTLMIFVLVVIIYYCCYVKRY